MRENFQEICDCLCETLKKTKRYEKLQELRYVSENEEVTAIFEGGEIVINVRRDSGYSMIKDIMRIL